MNILSLHQIWHILNQLMLRKKDAWNWTIVVDSLKIKTEIFSWEKTKTVYLILLNIHGLSSVLDLVQRIRKTKNWDRKDLVINYESLYNRLYNIVYDIFDSHLKHARLQQQEKPWIFVTTTNQKFRVSLILKYALI